MNIRRRQRRKVPLLNTAALPDLIFTILFFFMIATHMRSEYKQLNYTMPSGNELSTIKPRTSIVNIYIGQNNNINNNNYSLQIDNQIIEINQLQQYIEHKKENLSVDEQEQMIISLHIDKQCPMFIVDKIKQQLRSSNTLKISYNATNLSDSI